MKKIVLILLLLMQLVVVGEVLSAEETGDGNLVAIAPFVNLTGSVPPLDFDALVYDYFEGRSANVVDYKTLETFFIQRRIRRLTSINRVVIREMREALKVDAIILGTIYMLDDGETPKLDVAVQILDTKDSSVIWIKSVSMSGDDKATFFGLGKVTSLEELANLAIRDLFADSLELIEKKIKKQSQLPPFEITRADFYPAVAKGGDKVDLIVEVAEIGAKPVSINAVVKDINITMMNDRDRWFKGSFYAPAAEGEYPLKLYASSQWNHLYTFEGYEHLTVDNTPPRVTLSLFNSLISPNNDGINDYAIFYPVMQATDTLKGWNFRITDSQGAVVRSEEGDGQLPTAFIWRGENDKFKTVGDGTYFGQLTTEDRAGHGVSTEKIIVSVDRTLPEIVLVPEPDEAAEDTVTFAIRTKDVSGIVAWNITIFDDDGNVLKNLGGDNDLPEQVTCEIKKKTLKNSTPIPSRPGTRLEIC